VGDVFELRLRAERSVAEIVEGLLTAPQLMMERADVLWRALKAVPGIESGFQ